MELKTPLYDKHLELGGKIVPFAGYLLPVQYKTGIITEHKAVREAAGLFDVSHMGEIFFEGKDALNNLNHLLTNDFSKMQDGKVLYSLMCNENGGTIDDLLVYKFNSEKYMVVVNASNRKKDFSWMKENIFGDIKISDESDNISLIALQGPNSLKILEKITTANYIPTKYYTFIQDANIDNNLKCIISKTGYTGEDGYEIYSSNDDIIKIWDLILEAGKEFVIAPCGLGSRDTLRLEASMPLYGHELNEDITPFECGLNFAVKLNKENFIGKESLLKKQIPNIKRVGLEITGRGIAREQDSVFFNDKKIGFTTSGTHCPYLGKAYAMAYLDPNFCDSNESLQVEVRGKKIDAKITELPFYKKN